MLAEAESHFPATCEMCISQISDRCTKFFHDMIKRNNKRNTIVAIVKRPGEHTTSLSEVATEFEEYLQELLGTTMLCRELVKYYVRFE